MEMMTVGVDLAKPEQVKAPKDRYEKELAEAMAIFNLIKGSMAAAGSSSITQATVGMLVLANALVCMPEDGGPRVRNIARRVKEMTPGITKELNIEGAEAILGILTANEDGTADLKLEQTPFELGKVVVSAGIQEHTQPSFVLRNLSKYMSRDWGNQLTEEEVTTNNMNTDSGVGMIFAIYPIREDLPIGPENQIYVVTSSDRTETKICLPAEY